MTHLKGIATGIGSLPHKDAEEALNLIFKSCPQIPFWPQLPRRDKREGMVTQFIQKLPIPQTPDNDTSSLEEFYEKIVNKDLDYFKITQDYAAGLYAFKDRLKNEQSLLNDIEFIKCQITGPFTSAASIKDENGAAYLHNSVIMQAFIEGLKMKALWQIKFFKEFGKKIIMFIDEPYLGCFGSAYTPVNREDLIKGLTELTEGIKSEGVSLGVHCCGNTDWSIFTDVEAIDIINFDAFGFQDKFLLYADKLKEFTKRGGIICWGIVPTQEFSPKQTAGLLAEKLESGINFLIKKGLNKDLLYDNLLISPACGMGALDQAKSVQIFGLLRETSQILRNR